MHLRLYPFTAGYCLDSYQIIISLVDFLKIMFVRLNILQRHFAKFKVPCRCKVLLILTCQLIEQRVKELSSSGRHGFKFWEPFRLWILIL